MATDRLINNTQGTEIINALTAITNAIGNIDVAGLHVDWSYTVLPATGNSNIIYAIPTGDTEDPYDFYAWNDADQEFVQIDFKIDITIDSSLSSSSTNPVQNAVITTALADKVDAENGKGLSTNDFTDTLKTKLDGIESGAQVNPTIDSELSSSSENAVQNKVVTAALDGKVDEVAGKGLSTNDYTNEEKALVATIPGKADADEVTEVDTSNSTPFLYRETPYEADGVFLDELVGGSVAWNQLIQNGNFADSSNWSLRDSSKGTLSISNNIAKVVYKSSATSGLYDYGIMQQNIVVNRTHKIHISFDVRLNYSGSFGLDSFGSYGYVSCTANTWTHFAITFNDNNSSQTSGIILRPLYNVTQDDYFEVKNVQIIDLTQTFGTAIADYIYTLEQATAGSGIAWLKSHGFFTKDYYPYNTGELISVKTSGKKYVGFNQWDEEWEVGQYGATEGAKVNSSTNNTTIRSANFIPVLQNTEYYFYNIPNKGRRVFYYDENKEFITSVGTPTTFTTPYNCRYITFHMQSGDSGYGTVYNHDICINISKTEGTPKNGDYVPYEEHTYDISNIELRGIPKLVNNELVYDGDIYESDGDVTRNYGIVDMGSLDWGYATSSYGVAYFNSSAISGIKPNVSHDYMSNVLCPNYLTVPTTNSGITASSFIDKSLFVWTNGTLYLRDSNYTDAATFKTAMSGVYLVYELATPTTETTDSYTNPQVCDKDGTEEFIDNRTVSIPVGHNSRYADLPAIMDGDYLGYMTRNFASKEYVKDVIDDLPKITYDFRPISPTQVDVSAGMGTTVSITTRYTYFLTLIRMRLSSNGEVVASAMCYGTFEERLTYKSLDGTTAVSAKVEKVDDGYEVSNELESTAKVYIDIIPLFAHAIG